MKTTETIRITTNEVDDNLDIGFVIEGDHELRDSDDDEASLAFIVAFALWELVAEGVLFEHLKVKYGIEITGHLEFGQT